MFNPFNSIFVGNLDLRVTPDDIKHAIRPYVSQIISVNVTSKYCVSSHAFVRFGENDNISYILRNLRTAKISLYGIKPRFKNVRKKVTKNVGVDQQGIYPECNKLFELEPADPSLPCGHGLVDDILLQIFSHLSMPDMIQCGKVCRRFQYLVDVLLMKKLKEYQNEDKCFIEWLEGIGIFSAYKLLSPFLSSCGHSLKTIDVNYSLYDLKILFELIGDHCPNLEELSFPGDAKPFYILNNISQKCKKLKKICLKDAGSLNIDHFNYIFTKCKELETFQTHHDLHVAYKSFKLLPNSLKEFSCFGSYKGDKSPWKFLFRKCHQLEVYSSFTPITVEDLKVAAKACPNMRKLQIDLDMEENQFDWSLFPNLTKLSIVARNINLNTLASCKSLDNLILKNNILSTSEVTGDFSLLKNLRFLYILISPDMSDSTLESLCACQQLETLKVIRKTGAFGPILKCIECLPKLSELIYTDVQLSKSDLQSLYCLGKTRKQKLKLVITLYDTSLADEAEKLNDVNYELDMNECGVFHDVFSEECGVFHDVFSEDMQYSEYLDYDDDYDDDSFLYDSPDEFGYPLHDLDNTYCDSDYSL